jgi:serine/threonine protein kinase
MSRTTTKIIIAQEDGTVVGQYFLGDGEHLIGRETHCTIQLEATHVSREHAKLIISADAVEIEDLGSTSGTSLDGISVKGRIPIQPGQKLWISDLYIDIERQGFGGLVEGSRLGDGRFTLKRELGKGGMGAVWLALYEETQENFALKLVSGESSLDPKCLKELQREVNKSHNLVHPNIVRMGYFWKEEGEPAFISLEYVDGTDLDQLRSDSPDGLLAWKDVQTYMLQLCDALKYAHAQKVAHRDIKPSNFMIDREGNLKLADFGIAATLNSSSLSFTASSVLGLGTPPYMSPQQLDGKRPQVTDDIYSVGATFYDLLTSKPPFHQGDISYQVRHTEVTPMSERLEELELANDIPEHVNAIVMACLHKDPAQRPQSMRVICEWIQSGEEVAVEPEKVSPTSARETQLLDPTPSPITEKTPTGGSRKKWVYGIAAVVLAVVVGTAVILHDPGKSGSENESGEEGDSATRKVAAAEKVAAEKAAAEKAVAEKAVAEKAAAEKAAAEKAAAEKAAAEKAAAEKAAAEKAVAEKAAAEKAAAEKVAAEKVAAGTFVNTLGMKFVSVPGTDVQFCIWETRVKDYAAYAAAKAGVHGGWKNFGRGFKQADTHPVVKVSWNDAQAFCEWLTKKELAEGKITASQRYRLPKDAEWSVAVGLGKEKGSSPEEKSRGIKDVYPWGKGTPPVGAGNYSESLKVDKFEYTSPAGSFASNKDGLHDLGGNVLEWCEDKYRPTSVYRVLRGASWLDGSPGDLLSSSRYISTPDYRNFNFGFRCVLVGGSGG